MWRITSRYRTPVRQWCGTDTATRMFTRSKWSRRTPPIVATTAVPIAGTGTPSRTPSPRSSSSAGAALGPATDLAAAGFDETFYSRSAGRFEPRNSKIRRGVLEGCRTQCQRRLGQRNLDKVSKVCTRGLVGVLEFVEDLCTGGEKSIRAARISSFMRV